MDDLINQGGEAFLFIFIIGGALAMMVWMFFSDPKKFIKWILKDFLNDLKNNNKDKKEEE